MKCQNCGKNDVNYRLSSNINGCVTETHICSECAEQAGFDIEKVFSIGNIFEEIFSILNRNSRYAPAAVPAMSSNTTLPIATHADIGKQTQDSECNCDCGYDCRTSLSDILVDGVDDNMRKRRELYMQMHLAVDNEDYEKAAELRDMIKDLE